MPAAIDLGTILGTLDMFGIAVFAASGALAAAAKRQTFVTFTFFALVTGVGGGTVRDLLIGAPVFWIVNSRVLVVVLAVSALLWVTPQRWWEGRMLDWFDAVGLGAYSVFGAAKAMQFGVDPLPAVMMGVITACVGGIIRDVLAGEPSIILRPELYVTAAALGSGSYVALRLAGLEVEIAAIIGAVAGFVLRGLAIRYNIALPAYRGGSRSED
ncbi:trimeric intracellular cation channel family protein [Sphingomonas sp. CCH18-B1]|uniref:trimeric intracellular cation channel family protein n=1 Tax=Sphingomonas sp. CCH18-B1 TaxID=1768744 RepID=UPI003FA6E69F